MRSSLIRRCASAVCLSALVLLSYGAPTLFGQGGEPQYFAIRGAKVVPVSGPPVENATVVVSRGDHHRRRERRCDSTGSLGD